MTESVKPEETDQSTLQSGYFVGLKEDGSVVFQLVGSNPGIFQVLGAHQYAGFKLQQLLETNMKYGMPVVLQQNNMTLQLLQKLVETMTNAQNNRIVMP